MTSGQTLGSNSQPTAGVLRRHRMAPYFLAPISHAHCARNSGQHVEHHVMCSFVCSPPAMQLLYLQLGAVGAGSRESDHVASHLGKAVGITTLLQGTPFHAAHRRSYLPIDLCVQHHVSQASTVLNTDIAWEARSTYVPSSDAWRHGVRLHTCCAQPRVHSPMHALAAMQRACCMLSSVEHL